MQMFNQSIQINQCINPKIFNVQSKKTGREPIYILLLHESNHKDNEKKITFEQFVK